MKKLNNKGFTMVELMAAIAILGILTVAAITAVTQYVAYATKKGYDTLAKSASNAAEDYIMDYPNRNVISYEFVEDGLKTEDQVGGPYAYNDKAKRRKIFLAAEGVTLKELVEEGYLSTRQDPANDNKKCKGRVIIAKETPEEDSNVAKLEKYSYVVYMCCSIYKARYAYTYGSDDVRETVTKNFDPKLCEEKTPLPESGVYYDGKYYY